MACIGAQGRAHKRSIANYSDHELELSYRAVTVGKYWLREPREIGPFNRILKRLIIQEYQRRNLV
jgi:hypothetical protein